MTLCYGLLLIFWCEQPAAPPAIVACPPLVQWEAEFQGRMANEIEKLPPNSALAVSVRQHLRLREQLRNCKK